MGKTLSTIAIIQARLNSIRFPNKVMQKINGKPLIEILIERVASAKEVNKIVVATSVNKKNKKLIEFLKRKKISFYQGSENNVLKRMASVRALKASTPPTRWPRVSSALAPRCIRHTARPTHTRADHSRRRRRPMTPCLRGCIGTSTVSLPSGRLSTATHGSRTGR